MIRSSKKSSAAVTGLLRGGAHEGGHATACCRPCQRRGFWRIAGFSLIEIMSVLAVIIILIGAVGFSLRDNAGSSLTSAQNTLGSLIGQARAQAAVNQTEARLMIYGVRGSDERYLRLLQVFIASPQGSTTWVPVGSPVYLPRGVYVVPPTTTGLLATGVTWLTNPAPVSTFGTGPNPNQLTGTAFNGANTVFFVQFTADGSITPTPNPYIKLAVTTGAIGTNSLPAFNNQFAVRGILIRPNGAVSYVNSTDGF